MAADKIKPLYVSLSTANNAIGTYDSTTSPEGTELAIVNLQFNSPVIEKASDYLVCIERLCINTNAIPFYDGTETPVEQIFIFDRATNNFNGYACTFTAYSLSDLLDTLNLIAYKRPPLNTAVKLTFTVTADGYIYVVSSVLFNVIEVIIPRRLNKILGLSTNEMSGEVNYAYSSFPRIDLGDDLDHIMLKTDLPTHTDAIGNSRASVLTDFAPPTAYSNSLSYADDNQLEQSGFSTHIRQKMIYVPTERRYLDLIGDFPINNITIEAFYKNTDDILKRIVLPLGGVFEVKLGFYRKS